MCGRYRLKEGRKRSRVGWRGNEREERRDEHSMSEVMGGKEQVEQVGWLADGGWVGRIGREMLVWMGGGKGVFRGYRCRKKRERDR